jgi:hypothetical protein
MCDQLSHMSDPGDTRGQQDHTGGYNHSLQGGWCVTHHMVLVLGLLVMVPVVPIRGDGVTWPVAPEPPCEQVLARVESEY